MQTSLFSGQTPPQRAERAPLNLAECEAFVSIDLLLCRCTRFTGRTKHHPSNAVKRMRGRHPHTHRAGAVRAQEYSYPVRSRAPSALAPLEPNGPPFLLSAGFVCRPDLDFRNRLTPGARDRCVMQRRESGVRGPLVHCAAGFRPACDNPVVACTELTENEPVLVGTCFRCCLV